MFPMRIHKNPLMKKYNKTNNLYIKALIQCHKQLFVCLFFEKKQLKNEICNLCSNISIFQHILNTKESADHVNILNMQSLISFDVIWYLNGITAGRFEFFSGHKWRFEVNDQNK